MITKVLAFSADIIYRHLPEVWNMKCYLAYKNGVLEAK